EGSFQHMGLPFLWVLLPCQGNVEEGYLSRIVVRRRVSHSCDDSGVPGHVRPCPQEHVLDSSRCSLLQPRQYRLLQKSYARRKWMVVTFSGDSLQLPSTV